NTKIEEEIMYMDKENLKQEILDILKKHNYISGLSECPMTTLKFLLKIDNAHLDASPIYDALCELEEEDKVIKSFEPSAGNLNMKINASRWYLKQ
ncbi:30S ribosomal protein S8, partial [Clostridium luticellarii]